MQDGRSVDTTMGFTPLDGLVMATRSGSIDPGLLLWLLEQTGMPERDMAEALEHQSGLLALAGAGDMRAVLQAAGEGDERAILRSRSTSTGCARGGRGGPRDRARCASSW